MPFDAMVDIRRATLSDRLAVLGITPVPMAVLEAHKAEQVRQYPRSVFLTSKPYVLAACLGGALRFLLTFVVPPEPVSATIAGSTIFAGIFAMLTGMGAVIYSQRRGLRDTPRWVEYFVPSYYHQIPAPISEVVREVRRWVPEACMIEGKLMQKTTVLDPYILVQYNDEVACLGIWDDQTVIACATMV